MTEALQRTLQQVITSLRSIRGSVEEGCEDDAIIDNALDRASESIHMLETALTSPQSPLQPEVEHGDTSGDEAAPYLPSDYIRGVEDAIEIIERRGREIRGAVQPDITVRMIRSELISNA